MSYTIEYNRQFIKTKNGYIPCVLFGDNNVTEGRGRYERRYRSWSIFLNLVDVSEEKMIKSVKQRFSSYDQNWKRGSEWITNEGMIKWVKSGCRKAVTIEEIIKYNHLIFPVICTMRCYPKGSLEKKEIMKNIKTNLDLEEWILEYKEFKENNKDLEIYPIIDFGIEDIKCPNKNTITGLKNESIKDTDKFALKGPTNKWGYICQLTKPGERLALIHL